MTYCTQDVCLKDIYSKCTLSGPYSFNIKLHVNIILSRPLITEKRNQKPCKIACLVA